MTINELNTSKWQEFAFDLVDAKKRQILEKPYQERIEAAFRALGWSKAKGEICPIDGGMNYFGKGKFVREIVATYLSAHPSITFVQLEQIFPEELQGSYGVVRSLEDIFNSDHDLKDLKTRYVMDEDKILTTKE